jgi:glycosyltransferase involved in cell wall biosynthesis
MKVLVVHNAYQSHHVGGEDVVVEREVKSLKQALGADNVFEYSVSNDTIHPLKLSFTIWGDRHHSNRIKQCVQENNIDIVHVHNFFPLLTPRVFVGAKKAGAKVVQTLHNFRWWCLSGILYRPGSGHCEKCIKKSFAWPALFYRCYRGSRLQSFIGVLAFAWYRKKRYLDLIDRYFVLTHFQLEKLKPLLPAQKMVIKPNLINKPANAVPFNKKQHYLFVGRLEEAKGFPLVLSLWRQLPATFHLDVIGGDLNENYSQMISLPNIRFLGKLSHHDTLTHMAKAKYVLQTSLAYETFGLTIIEAMAEGTPVIGLNVGTRPELIQSGHNGFITTPDKLYETLLQADAYRDYEQLCQNAWEDAKVYYSDVVIEKQIALYQEVLKQDD